MNHIDLYVCFRRTATGQIVVYQQPFTREQATAFCRQAARFGLQYTIVKKQVALDPDTFPTPDATP
jgi:hypothetical protein